MKDASASAMRPSHVERRVGPRVGPGVAVGVSEEMIGAVVHAFYAKVRRDPALGPIFERVLAGGWDAHLAKLCDFWSSVLLMTGRFKGAPMGAHARLPELRATHFARWLHLFRETATETCPPAAAALFVARAEMIAQSLQMGIAASRGESRVPALRLTPPDEPAPVGHEEAREPASTILPGYEASGRTREFSEATVPDKLRTAHSTAEGVWALIHVTAGRLRYRVLDPARPSEVVLTPDAPPGVIRPTQLHEVEPLGPVRFSLEFFRRVADAPGATGG